MTCDTACVRIARPMEQVFDFMADPANMALWNIGTVDITTDEHGLCRGRSASGGATVFIRIEPHTDQMLIDYFVGDDPGALLPRIFVRILPGAVRGEIGSVLLMTAVRAKTMDDARWQTLIERHATEVNLIKEELEAGDA